jgi:hypothetical protein
MPQMDMATFLGQVTWFFRVFSTFYLIVLTDLLPTLNRAIKVRVKKADQMRQFSSGWTGSITQADGQSTQSRGRGSKVLKLTEDHLNNSTIHGGVGVETKRLKSVLKAMKAKSSVPTMVVSPKKVRGGAKKTPAPTAGTTRGRPRGGK